MCNHIDLSLKNPNIQSGTFFLGSDDQTKVALDYECPYCGDKHEVIATVD